MEVGILVPLVTIFVLLVFSAFFSGSETAMTALSRARLHAQEKEGNKRAKLVNKIRERKDRMIGALLLGNNFVNIMASAVATSMFIRLFGESGVVYATFVMTAVVLIFSEVLPKTYALHNADRLALRVAPLVRLIILFLSPITEMVTWIVRGILRVFGVDISKVSTGSHLELLRGAIDMHSGKGRKVQQQRVMLRSILDLFEVDVSEIMTHRKNVTMVDADLKVEKIVDEVLQSAHTRLPIWQGDQDNIIGILHSKILLQELRDHQGDYSKIRINDICLEPWFIPDSTTLNEQLQAFRERKEHFAIVVDEYGTFMGIVTLEDILEEIVGEIDDEHDETVAGVRKMKDGAYIINGDVTIRDLDREYGWGLPDENYSTIAGLVIHEAQAIPEIGQVFTFYDFRFDIIKRHRNQITQIRVTPPEKEKKVS
ncbi:MAG TPA: hypothetical protein DEA55_10655 [Rhodospirillaceae bacterium]|nr:hypothetical protein [Rhodospirillaceae bacterium]